MMDEIEKQTLYKESIMLLKKEGTRFTVDDLSSSLHMSKKTIYSVFSSKEDLANWIYDTSFDAFDKILADARASSPISWPLISSLFLSFADILNISEESTFNRYSLNASLKKRVIDEYAKKEDSLKRFLSSSQLLELMNHPSFFPSLKATLLTFSYLENEKSLIDDFVLILKDSL